MVTPIVYTYTKTETFENAAGPVLVENSGVAFQCNRTKMETFENDGMAAHIRSSYP